MDPCACRRGGRRAQRHTGRESKRRDSYRYCGLPAEMKVAKAFGADYAVDYMDKEWQGNVLDILKANKRTGVDVMFDPAGMVNPSLKVVAWNARILVVGFAGGVIEEIKVNKVLLKHVSVMGIHWTMYLRFEPGTVEDVWRGLFELINQGKFRPTVYTDKEYVGLESVKVWVEGVGEQGDMGEGGGEGARRGGVGEVVGAVRCLEWSGIL